VLVGLDWLLLVCEKLCGSDWSTSLLVLQIGGDTDVLSAASCASRLVAGLAGPHSYAMAAISPQLWQRVHRNCGSEFTATVAAVASSSTTWFRWVSGSCSMIALIGVVVWLGFGHGIDMMWLFGVLFVSITFYISSYLFFLNRNLV
jgi:hypothetical protein